MAMEGRLSLIIKMLSIEGMFSFLMVQLLLLTLSDILEFYWDRVCSLCLGALALLPHPLYLLSRCCLLLEDVLFFQLYSSSLSPRSK